MKFYGLSYQGSKNFIAARIARDLPSAENYYDLFCGGGAVLQAVSEKKKYKNYYANELYPKISSMVRNEYDLGIKTDNLYIPKSQKFDDPLEEDMLPMFRSNYAESDFNW